MEEDSDGEDLTPFWVQPTTNRRRSDRFSSTFFSFCVVVFILILIVAAGFFLYVLVPSALSFSNQILKPGNVKKSSDFLNVFLVLAAVLFGFLSRNGTSGDRYSSYYGDNQEFVDKRRDAAPARKSPSPNRRHGEIDGRNSPFSAPNQWYGYPDYQNKEYVKTPFLRRNSSSYPDLREATVANWASADFRSRFNDDDVEVDLVQQRPHRRHRSLEEVDLIRQPLQADTVVLHKLVKHSEEAAKSPPELYDRSSEPVKERSGRKVEKKMESIHPDSVPKIKTPPQPPPPPPTMPPHHLQSSERERKRGGSIGSSSATKDFLNSLYNKKKKRRHKSVESLDFLHQAQDPPSFQLPPPSPPPPPPPPSSPSVFQTLFLPKKPKRKRTIIVRVKSPPPAPTPPPQQAAALEQKIESQIETRTTHQPPRPVKMDSFETLDEISNSGGESPFHRAPPPPPPPPPFFKKPAWKFVVQGDYVRLDSNNSSRSGSPDPDEVDSDDTPRETPPPPGEPPSPLFCPSPDVNTKAESFITNFRAKLKLEKIDSMKSRKLGLSSLGPGPSHT